ncbi:chromosome segregation protein SMC [Candidatus Micrarchaeota archaeon]|nr:MAG: chromosome segregation protein SMC [Candidatus Micrarchaeota archaeon]
MTKLEKIKLKNFKSFRNVSIPLAMGHTTIVGPNGSGKSNILDAICFVLGTTSMKALRATRLTDLVNHNSKDGTAEVTISIRDDGGERFDITRIIDKGGSSIFKVNGKRTTMKDVEELLSRMGIHPDGHNIIMQGDVTRFIKMTPLQRRQIIDEISGIAEYEEKKQEAMKELEKVQTKIKEAEIVLSERKSYLRILESERREAKRYQDLQEKRKVYKASILRIEVEKAEKRFKRIIEKISKLEGEISAIDEKKKALTEKLKQLEEEYNKITDQIFKEGDKRQADVSAEIEQIKGSIAMLDGRIRAIRESLENEQARKEKLLSEYSSLGNQLAAKEKEIEKIILEIDEVTRDLNECKKELEELGEAEDLSKLIDNVYSEIDKLNAEIEKKKEALYKTEIAVKTITERIKLKKAILEDYNAKDSRKKLAEIEDRIRKYSKTKEECKKDILSFENKLKELYSEEKELDKELKQKESKLSELIQKKAALESKISVLKNISGLSQTAEEIKKAGLKGILGTIAELCNYGTKYSKAIETAAGPRMFYIVTQSTEDAINAVKYLKSKKLGRATFIPLDKIKARDMHSSVKSLLKHPKALDLAVKLITYDKKYENAMKYVFGDTLVVKDIEAVKEIGLGKIRMVTLDGDLASEQGVISGGFSKGLGISDVKQLDDLKALIKDYENAKKLLMRRLEELREKQSELRSKKSSSELKMKEADVMLKEWQRRFSEQSKVLKSGERQSMSILKELKGMEEALIEKERQKGEIEKELDELIEKRNAMKQELSSYEKSEEAERVKQLKQRYEELKNKKTELELQKKSIETEAERVLLKSREEVKLQISEIDERIKKMTEELERNSKERNDLIRVQKEKEIIARKLASSMTELYEARSKIETERSKLNEEMIRLESKRESLSEKLSEAKVNKANIETEYFNLKNQLSSYKDVEFITDKKEEQLQRQLIVIEREMSEMGYVNMKAIEKYEEYAREVKEIEEKAKKLREEKDSILKLMNEIEKRKIDAFMKAFEALNKNFNRYFKEFYPEKGSYASIELDNKEKPLESGLLLSASPAGKKMKHIEAMSGGEKTVTALAFLFAIQAYNPSPFYVLDEADAALDPANSQRVARMIKKFSRETQIITITHNRYIIEEADQIIGVHMSKDGSSLIELDMKAYVGDAKEKSTEAT